VVVAEAGPSRARQDDAASSSVITASRTPRSAEDLPQLLSELPGVSVTRLGGLGSMATLSLRGSSANQVEVYFDGVPLSAASGGGVDIGLIPVVDLDSVEVYRGMSPIGFGSSAIGGIVSLSSAAATDRACAPTRAADLSGPSLPACKHAGPAKSCARSPA
jgi:outer membrane cobalamin receptor